MLPSGAGVSLMWQVEGDVDCTLRGTPWNLFRLGLSRDTQDMKKIFGDDVSISGDIEFGQEMKQAFDSMDIDWEEHLSHVVGDVIAHQIGDGVKSVLQLGQSTAETIRQNLSEYLHEELRHFPPREECEDFFHDVDALRDDVERIAARFNKLKKGQA